ncbi:hypothetical protein F5148DRAFT_1276411 [Russula earlei]|uniref:Uncharacterized protein n=1 Tax=Russula earlei TaxID=71964 RepID=A0ACC0U686_9AGAM|nr:hypothetical protein F5148DRAFT_1276411 [Russula earlei]
MAHTKDKHYWAQLRTALTAGSWGSSHPAKSFNGAPISWTELLRKFNKHCHGYADVSEIANQTQALALLVAGGPTDVELDGDQAGEDSLAPGAEGVVASEHADEVRVGFEALKALESQHTNSDSLKLALAHYAYALESPAQCLSYLGQVRDLANAQSRLNLIESLRSTTSSVQISSVSTNTSSVSFIGSLLSTESTSTVVDIADGKAWAAIEVVRSVCLQGMSLEKIRPTDTSTVLSVYLSVTKILPTIEGYISRSFPPNPLHAPSSSTGHSNNPSFTRYLELWRWVERLLRRAIIAASRTYSLNGPQEAVLWSLFSQYQTCNKYWPPTFRSKYRSTVMVLFVRALVLRTRPTGHLPTALHSHFRSENSEIPVTASMVGRRAIQDYRDILNASTRFPKAGECNVKVEELTDLCVAVWEASGCKSGDAGWVMDILWWATRLTFNAPRVFRHMMRIAEASGDTVLATRALRLYVHTVGKANLARKSTEPDATWVSTLVWGVRMLCRLALAADSTLGHRGMDEAREAGVILEKAKERLDPSDKALKARAELAEGIWNTVMAIKEQDHLSRASRLANALSLLESSIQDQPSASAHFHIALALYKPIPGRDLGRAIENARTAVELESDNIRYWHLLGLLLAASEDWRGAREVLEAGCRTSVAGENLDSSTLGKESKETDSSACVTVTDSSSLTQPELLPSPRSEVASSTVTQKPIEREVVLDAHSRTLPPAGELLQPLPDHPNPSVTERFEHALQLRMTQLALTELMEGPEGTEEKWIEVFQWFAKRKGPERDQSQRTSMETALRSLDVKSDTYDPRSISSLQNDANGVYASKPVPIPGSPTSATHDEKGVAVAQNGRPKISIEDTEKEKEKDKSAGKKVQKMLKNRVHKEQRRISTIGRKIGHGVGRQRGGLTLRRTSSTPTLGIDQASYQASSIHSRRHSPYASTNELVLRPESPPPLPPPSLSRERRERSRKECRLLSELWLMSAATFRRSGKIEQARGAIQEAEVRDEENPNLWVQLGLYHTALGHPDRAVQAFNKALFIFPDSIPATVHLSQAYLALAKEGASEVDNIDLVAGILSDLTQGPGWDVPEAWYFLGKAHGMRGMRDRERECLGFALGLAEGRPLRDFGEAVGWCL